MAARAKVEPYRNSVKAAMAFRGIDFIAAPTLVCELGDIRRFGHPRELMYYLGLVPGERSSGDRSIRGATAETGKHVPARHLYLRHGSTHEALEPALLFANAIRALRPRLSTSHGMPNAG